MVKVLRRKVVALAFAFWILSGFFVVKGVTTYPPFADWWNEQFNPQTPKLDERGPSTIHFMLPPSPAIPSHLNPTDRVSVSYTLTGVSIVEDVPLTMTVTMTIPTVPNSGLGLWQVDSVTVTPDNALYLFMWSNGTVANSTTTFQRLTQVNTGTTDLVWTKTEHVWFTAYGILSSTVDVWLSPSNEMYSVAAEQAKSNLALPQHVSVDNSTSVLIDSSKTVAAQELATRTNEEGISLTWFILFLASVDLGFNVLDYRFSEKEYPTEGTNRDGP